MTGRSLWRSLASGVLVAGFLLPLYWAVVSSFTPERQLFAAPTLVPRTLVLDHYRTLFGERDFWTPVRNSLIVAGATTLLSVALGSVCAYAIARLRFRGKGLTLAFILAVSMFPQISIVSPLYLMLRELRLLNTYPGLVLPLSRPGIASVAILTFLYSWNEFLFALSFTLGPERYTVPVAITLFRGQYQVPWGQILAAAIVATLPVAAIVMVAQRRIVSGLTEGAVKG